MNKRKFYTEAAYYLGLFTLAIGTAMMTRGDFGVSTVVAPAYILHLKISEYLPFFTFGMAEYTLQGVLLVVVMLMRRKVRWTDLLAFGTAVLYGLMLDASMAVVPVVTNFALRLLVYIAGFIICVLGVSLLFRTYIPPEAYEIFVKELSVKFNADLHQCKTVYDLVGCVVSIAMSFAFFGFGVFRGIELGTVLCAIVNGYLISLWSRFWDKHFVFCDRFPARKYFE